MYHYIYTYSDTHIHVHVHVYRYSDFLTVMEITSIHVHVRINSALGGGGILGFPTSSKIPLILIYMYEICVFGLISH